MRRTVFAETYTVVRENEDDGKLHQSRQPDRWLHIIEEVEEGRRIRPQSAMSRDAVGRGTHGVLANTEVRISSRIAPTAADRAFGTLAGSIGTFEITSVFHNSIRRR